MAIYEYEILNDDGSAKGIFETEQKMSEPALSHHPVTGEPVRRILSRTFARTSSGSYGSSGDSCASGACGLPSGGGGCGSGACGWN